MDTGTSAVPSPLRLITTEEKFLVTVEMRDPYAEDRIFRVSKYDIGDMWVRVEEGGKKVYIPASVIEAVYVEKIA